MSNPIRSESNMRLSGLPVNKRIFVQDNSSISGVGVAFGCAGPGFGGLDFAIAWSARVVQFVDEARRSQGDLVNRAIEGRLVRARRASSATQFADELDCG